MKIETKFVIGNREGIDALAFIAKATARQKFKGKISDQELEHFVNTNLNDEVLLTELNSMSNQYLIVYSDGKPVGYSKVTSKGARPQAFDGKTLSRIADFNILEEYNNASISKPLFEKCISLTSRQQIVWIGEYAFDPYLDLFESFGFKLNSDIIISKELPLAGVCLVKENLI